MIYFILNSYKFQNVQFTSNDQVENKTPIRVYNCTVTLNSLLSSYTAILQFDPTLRLKDQIKGKQG